MATHRATARRAGRLAILLGLAIASVSTESPGQTVRTGARGSRLVEWNVNGVLNTLAVLSDGSATVGGGVAASIPGGSSTRPALWRITSAGAVTQQIIATLPGGSPADRGFVSRLSRNGQYLVGVTYDSSGNGATFWQADSLSSPELVGEVPGAIGSEGVAVSNGATIVGTAFDGSGDITGFIQPPGFPAGILPPVNNAAALTELLPNAISADGSVVVGRSVFSDGSASGTTLRATVWTSGSSFAQLLFPSEALSVAYGVSPGGRYVVGFRRTGAGTSAIERGYVFDRTQSSATYLEDADGEDWPDPAVDVSDDGRLLVGFADVFTAPSTPTAHGAFVAVDGVATTLDEWLRDEFNFSGLNLDIAPAVFKSSTAYYLLAQSSSADKGYLVTLPLTSIFPTHGPGDFDGNGVVDGADILVWQRTDRSVASLARWRENFGQAVSQASVVAVAEPSTRHLLAAALVAAALMLRGDKGALRAGRLPRVNWRGYPGTRAWVVDRLRGRRGRRLRFAQRRGVRSRSRPTYLSRDSGRRSCRRSIASQTCRRRRGCPGIGRTVPLSPPDSPRAATPSRRSSLPAPRRRRSEDVGG